MTLVFIFLIHFLYCLCRIRFKAQLCRSLVHSSSWKHLLIFDNCFTICLASLEEATLLTRFMVLLTLFFSYVFSLNVKILRSKILVQRMMFSSLFSLS